MNAIFDYIAVVLAVYGTMKLIGAYSHWAIANWKDHKEMLVEIELFEIEYQEDMERLRAARREDARSLSRRGREIKQQLLEAPNGCTQTLTGDETLLDKTSERIAKIYEDALCAMREYAKD